MAKLMDLTGQRFGRWLVRSRNPRKTVLTSWICECECGRVGPVQGQALRGGHSASCGKCGSHHSRLVDLVGKRFGAWAVLRRAPAAGRRTLWLCRCDCGTERPVVADDLRSGKSSSCGCASRETRTAAAKDMTGERYGRLVVVGRADVRNGDRYWMCRCDCGGEKTVRGKDLLCGKILSCRCLHKEMVAERGRASATHGATRGGACTPEYHSWNGMRGRCGNPNDHGYADYGGRGITVCERWRSFENFLADMGPRPPGPCRWSIDRIDVNGNYEPGNCRWATDKVQLRNKRTTRYLEFNGKRLALSAWSEESGLSSPTIRRRLEAGWPVARALTEPARRRPAK